jgi:altronate hydrolase
MTTAPNMIVLGPADNVGIALRDIAGGSVAEDGAGRIVKALEEIPQGHKIALGPIAEGDRIVRFGVPVAIATAAIARGGLFHVHNVRSQYLDNDHDHFE